MHADTRRLSVTVNGLSAFKQGYVEAAMKCECVREDNRMRGCVQKGGRFVTRVPPIYTWARVRQDPRVK